MEDIIENEGTTLTIKDQYCVGCGICAKLAPDTFVISDQKARIIDENIKVEDLFNMESINKAVEKCPAKVIYFKA